MDGILIIDKPSGITSYQVVDRVKTATRVAKVGHGGTLDPLATGVLPLFLNRATKLVPFLMNGVKRYRATLQLGITTDTQDREGRVTDQSSDLPEDPLEITQAVNSFKGVISQIPPMYSALKYHGTPLYKLARKGLSLERTPRSVHIYAIKVLAVHSPLVTFEVECSPGTYIRTLCADIGQKLGCGAHLLTLKRLQNGHFGLDDSMCLEEVTSLCEKRMLKEHLVSLSAAFKHLPLFTVTNPLMTLLRAQKGILASQLKHHLPASLESEGLIQVGCAGDPEIALVQSLVSLKTLPAVPDTLVAWKRVCLYNPHENTIH